METNLVKREDLPPAIVPGGGLTSTVGDALQAQVQAQTTARFALARRFPRDDDKVRQLVLKECARQSFAKRAWYSKPTGDGAVTGPSIRFVEAAIRLSGHVGSEVAAIYDDAEQRIVRVTVMDYQTCAVHTADVVITKTVERRDSRGRDVLSQRKNKDGKTVYTVRATDDELLVKQGALVSKAIRTCGLRLLPADLIDEAQVAVQRALTRQGADPDQIAKDVCDDYAAIGVMPDEVKEYLGHDIRQCNPAELADLAGISNAIREGQTTWAEAIGQRRAEREPAPEPPQGEGARGKLGIKGAP